MVNVPFSVLAFALWSASVSDDAFQEASYVGVAGCFGAAWATPENAVIATAAREMTARTMVRMRERGMASP